MPPQSQRRRRTANHADNDPDESLSRRRSGRRPNDDSDGSAASEDEQEDVSMDRSGDGAEDLLANKLVRYALACEYARIPIKRDGIRDKGTFKSDLAFYTTHATTYLGISLT